jgi:hypothetical protein
VGMMGCVSILEWGEGVLALDFSLGKVNFVCVCVRVRVKEVDGA